MRLKRTARPLLVASMLVLTNDRFTFTVPDSVVAQCSALRDAPPSDEGPVPLPNVTASNIARIVEYHVRVSELNQKDASPRTVHEWKSGFFASMARPELYAVMEAANYLGAVDMLEDSCQYVSGLIRGMSSEQIRELFMMPVDWTAEEARAARAEFAWALK